MTLVALICAAVLAAFLILIVALQWQANRRYRRETEKRLDNITTLLRRNGT